MASPDRQLLAAWLRAIPQSRHAPRLLADLPGGDVIGQGLALLLQTWGAVEISPAGIRAASQPAHYFLHSLAAWAEMPGRVITDWSEDFGADDREGLRHGVSLVHLLERERLSRDPLAPPIRFTPVAQVLIVQAGPPPRFLVQWDAQSGYFQIIGGRQKEDQGWVEPIRDTAAREMAEELQGRVSYAAGAFRLELLADFAGKTRLSPSFGALTAYHFTFFRAAGLAALSLGPSERWVARAELLGGAIAAGEPVRGDHILLLEQHLARRIDTLPPSFAPAR